MNAPSSHSFPNTLGSNQLLSLLKTLRSKEFSGLLHLDVEVQGTSHTRVVLWNQGRLVWGGVKLPNLQQVVSLLKTKLQGEWTEIGTGFVMQQGQGQVRDVLERLVMMRLFSWEQIETVFLEQSVSFLEPLLPFPGSFLLSPYPQRPFSNGTDINEVFMALTYRQKEWATLSPQIPGSTAIPYLHSRLLQGYGRQPQNGQSLTQADEKALQALQKWIDGQQSLVEIAERQNRDPLSLARSLVVWVEKGWIAFNRTAGSDVLPMVLVVDDSDLMQKMISHTLVDHFRVKTANNAMDALSVIYHDPISLLILDVSMPVMDGLELCRTVRNLPQFNTLPIIMLTARDGFFDKVKGRMAGATEYLTKPFDADQLRQVVNRLIANVKTA